MIITTAPIPGGGWSLKSRRKTREVAQHIQHIRKTLEDANIKLASVISDIMIAGETDAELAELGSTRLICPCSDLIAALYGRLTAHRRFLIDHHLGLIEEFADRCFRCQSREALMPFRDASHG
jgi:hypothetical protein